MARTLAISEQTYQAGTYGPFAVDAFTEADTDALLVKFTQPSSGFPPYEISAGFDGHNQSKVIFAGGIVLDKQGVLEPLGYFRINVPQLADGQGRKKKGVVRRATVTVILGAPLTTAISVEAI